MSPVISDNYMNKIHGVQPCVISSDYENSNYRVIAMKWGDKDEVRQSPCSGR